jgi:uncharacterized protein (TIGR03067 family)
VGVEEQGNKIAEEDVKEAKETFVFKGRTMTYRQDGKVQVTMTITLDPAETPPEITLEFPDGNEKGNKNHAIYKLDGDTLKLRMNDKFGGNSADERPEDFSTDKGKEAVLFILKRETGPAAVALQSERGGQGDPPVLTSTQEEKKQAPEKQGEKPRSTTRGAKGDGDTLQGTWRVVGVEEQGNKIAEKDVKEAKETFVVKGRTMTYCRDGKVLVTMKFSRYPEKTPPAIMLVLTDGKEKGQKNHAIYKLEGDTLKLRMNDKFGGNSPDERPEDFSTDKGKEAVLFILKRETK